MEWKGIVQAIGKGEFQPVYFLQGEEPYFIDRIAEAVESNALREEERSFNQTTLYGRDTDMDTVINNARRFPMMAERQVVMVKEAQYLGDLNREAGQERLLDYVKNPVPSTVLVFCYMGKTLDGRKSFARELKKHSVFFTGKKIYENQVPGWIDEHLAEKKVKINPKAKVLLTEYIGNNLERMANEIDKILINHGEEGFTITELEIEKYVGINKDYNIFEFQNALLDGDTPRIFRILKYFEANEKDNSPIGTVAVTFSTLSKLLRLYKLENPDRSAVAKTIGINPFFADQYLKARNNYSFRQVADGIELLEQADAKMKGVGDGNMTKSQILQEFVLRFLHPVS